MLVRWHLCGVNSGILQDFVKFVSWHSIQIFIKPKLVTVRMMPGQNAESIHTSIVVTNSEPANVGALVIRANVGGTQEANH